MKSITICTYNIHKGMSPLNRHVKVGGMAEALAELAPDMLFLQEVQGKNLERALRHQIWPVQPQHHYLAGRLAHRAVYGLNASYGHGHHGNALLTRFPVNDWCNRDISVNRFESRGVLQCLLQPDGWPQPVVALCGHFNLLAFDRRKQYRGLADYVRQAIADHLPLILAGDFNDWRGEASALLRQELGLEEAFLTLHGRHAQSFPARMPMLALDRIYVRGLKVESARVLSGRPWSGLSDHLPLCAEIRPLG
ncbi:endonuclease/exonuclease/phosphatase family protein [Chromobacterium violaceum]|uniref:endonuclease/exonuclease/phosphatase family protein n=1 Tax=Chromobacterium violaceum TaxID=536 RepID=UPI0015FB7D26|nr:endonuclease/exonuclease/phosphatase family protein [Chromobacterium violaceum]MBA8737512.1 endonuclease/exonuclease/phosphatase family protein [Chromobacterium violaceum]